MILIKGRRELPKPRELAEVILGDNGEPFEEELSREEILENLEYYLETEEEISLPSIHFANGGWYLQETGALYYNCFGVLVRGIFWGRPEEICEIVKTYDLFKQPEIMSSASLLIQKFLKKFACIEIYSGPASALISEEAFEKWVRIYVDVRNGNGYPQKWIVKNLWRAGEAVFYTSLFGWITSQAEADRFLNKFPD